MCPPSTLEPATPAISHLAIYYQKPGIDPTGQVITAGTERVELLIAGRGWVEHAANWVEVTPGDLLWHTAGDPTIGRSDHNNPYICLNLGLRVPLSHQPPPRLSRWPDLVAARHFVDELVARWVDPAFPKDVLYHYAVGQLRYQTALWGIQAQRTRLPPAIQAARNLIETDFASPLRVKDLARVARCSAPHLLDLFRSHGLRSPHQELIAVRIREASRLLSTTDQPVKQIAAATGFSHAAAFCATFAHYTGYTPSAYRKAMRQQL
jgi:AraC-like DNA-binding protein